eukprot:TRINITY_DN2958_c0_g2_i4.p2 TRINITY_DN2958_c0_g2~~TRINITY_DN2958_c0_g2_i4.p2  ORF type:complete len:551 (+),score=185.16 TRINITY_DN2958_c0_g2_i4:112-1764(+)
MELARVELNTQEAVGGLSIACIAGISCWLRRRCRRRPPPARITRGGRRPSKPPRPPISSPPPEAAHAPSPVPSLVIEPARQERWSARPATEPDPMPDPFPPVPTEHPGSSDEETEGPQPAPTPEPTNRPLFNGSPTSLRTRRLITQGRWVQDLDLELCTIAASEMSEWTMLRQCEPLRAASPFQADFADVCRGRTADAAPRLRRAASGTRRPTTPLSPRSEAQRHVRGVVATELLVRQRWRDLESRDRDAFARAKAAAERTLRVALGRKLTFKRTLRSNSVGADAGDGRARHRSASVTQVSSRTKDWAETSAEQADDTWAEESWDFTRTESVLSASAARDDAAADGSDAEVAAAPPPPPAFSPRLGARSSSAGAAPSCPDKDQDTEDMVREAAARAERLLRRQTAPARRPLRRRSETAAQPMPAAARARPRRTVPPLRRLPDLRRGRAETPPPPPRRSARKQQPQQPAADSSVFSHVSALVGLGLMSEGEAVNIVVRSTSESAAPPQRMRTSASSVQPVGARLPSASADVVRRTVGRSATSRRFARPTMP